MLVSHTLPVGAELDVKLMETVADGVASEPLALRARVLRIQRSHGETDLALEFVDRIESAASRLQALVDSLLGAGPAAVARRSSSADRAAGESDPETPAATASRAPTTSGEGGEEDSGSERSARRELEWELAAQTERGDRAEAALESVSAQLAEERERRRAAERTLVTLQRELSLARAWSAESDEEDETGPDTSAVGEPAPRTGEGDADEDRLLDTRGSADLEEDRAGGSRDGECPADAAPDPVARPAPVGPAEVTSRVVFARLLREGGRLLPTTRFARFEPVSRLDVRIHEYARRESELAGIRRLAGRRVGEEDLIRVLYTFFERGLLELQPAARIGTGGGDPP